MCDNIAEVARPHAACGIVSSWRLTLSVLYFPKKYAKPLRKRRRNFLRHGKELRRTTCTSRSIILDAFLKNSSHSSKQLLAASWMTQRQCVLNTGEPL